MLELIEGRKEKIAVQKELAELLRNVWSHEERRRIVWRPSSVELDIAHEGELWFASAKAGEDGGTARYWNSFGEYSRNGNLNIAIEINIPIDTNDRRVSGFLARDAKTGRTYLMHDGGVGGGRKGVSREAFLEWASLKPIPVKTSDGDSRLGLIVSPLDKEVVDASVSSFVRRAIAFKAAVREGILDSGVVGPIGQSYRDYFREFSGKKSGERSGEFEYESRHGDIVDALVSWSGCNSFKGRIVKNAYIDLAVEAGGQLSAIFEVKTSVDRQCLYTAIGQLLVHSTAAPNASRFLVIPTGREPSSDILACLKTLGISIIKYAISGRAIVLNP